MAQPGPPTAPITSGTASDNSTTPTISGIAYGSRVASSTSTSGTTPLRGPFGNTCGSGCTVPLNPETISKAATGADLLPGTTYHYQLCGQGDDSAKYVQGYVCVGPDGTTSTSQTFTTAGTPPPETFARSAVTVSPNSTLSLHWARNENEYFILASSGANGFPNFQTAATFPAPGGSWQGVPLQFVGHQRPSRLADDPEGSRGGQHVCLDAVHLQLGRQRVLQLSGERDPGRDSNDHSCAVRDELDFPALHGPVLQAHTGDPVQWHAARCHLRQWCQRRQRHHYL